MTSSDDIRSAAPLLHAQSVTFDTPLRLELGGTLPGVTVVYETYGRLTPDRDNAVLICHALSGDSHVARHDEQDSPGWWDLVVGPGKTIDTERYFVICCNVLGGCRGTTGPNSINPSTGKPWGADFPEITVADMVDVQRMVVDHLGIESLLAVVGGSLGGHQALTWAVRYPQRVRGLGLIATSPRLTSQALAFDIVGRNAILRDPHFSAGQYYDKPDKPAVGLALARMLGHITYLSRQAMTSKFDPNRAEPRDIDTEFEKLYSVGSYLAYQGHRFVERFDANSYITLTRAMDRFDLGDTVPRLARAFERCDSRWLVLSFTSDWLFPPEQSRQIVDALVLARQRVSYCNIQSHCGHDAFLLEDDLECYGGMLGSFLRNLSGDTIRTDSPGTRRSGRGRPVPLSAPTSIFHGHRLDYDLILDLIPSSVSVLDLGCGQGELLTLLRDKRQPTRLMGVEVDQQAIAACIDQGLDVLHLDLENPLTSFTDNSFDIVVLSQTLQSIADTRGILREMLRVGRRCIVSFPNFAYHKLRKMLYEQGRSPKTPGIYSYDWYDTPNRRFPSILDFQDLCRSMGIRVEKEVYLDTESDRFITDDPNFNADMAVFVLAGV